MIDALRAVLARTVPEAGARPRLILRHGGGAIRDTDQAIVLDERGLPIVAVKTGRGARARALLREEHERLARLAATLLPIRPGAAPRPLGLHEVDDRAFLVESFLPGRRLKDLDPREIACARGAIDGTVSWLIDFTHATGIEPSALRPLVEGPVARYLDAFETSLAERALVGSIAPLLLGAIGEHAPTVVEHGDFADANVLVHGSSIGVVDWDEPVARALPGADLFHFLASIAATRSGLNDPGRMERGFIDAFFAPTRAAARNHVWVERYFRAVGVPRAAIRPLFTLAWVRLALHKLDYLEESGLLDEPGSNYPVTVFSGKRCLNVAWTARLAGAFEL